MNVKLYDMYITNLLILLTNNVILGPHMGDKKHNDTPAEYVIDDSFVLSFWNNPL